MASTLATESAKDMIKALIAGQRDPHTLAALARTRMKAKHDDLVEALDGMFDDHHGELAQLSLDQIAVCDDRIAQLTARAAELAAAMPGAWGINADGTTGPGAGATPDAPVLNAVARLAEIPGISADLARAIIAEMGLDMSRFPTAATWCPGPGCARPPASPAPAPGPGRRARATPGCAGPSARPRPAPPAPPPSSANGYARIARRRGKAKAQVAVARSILVIIWHLLKNPEARFTDLGHGYYQARTDTDRKLRNHIRQIQALGFTVTLTNAA